MADSCCDHFLELHFVLAELVSEVTGPILHEYESALFSLKSNVNQIEPNNLHFLFFFIRLDILAWLNYIVKSISLSVNQGFFDAHELVLLEVIVLALTVSLEHSPNGKQSFLQEEIFG